jgi:hypothetical protein
LFKIVIILNRKKDRIPRGGIYIGRGSHLGNPAAIGEDGDREEVLSVFGPYINREIDDKNPIILLKLRELNKNSILVCNCKPAACHGDIIEQVWNERILPGLHVHERSLSYAGFSAPDTPPEVLNFMSRLSSRLEEIGFVLRSRGADGADSAFDDGCENKEIFLPWPGFNDKESEFDSPTSEALRVMEVLHGDWQQLKQGAQRLLACNSHVILGADMRSPADFVVCWTNDGAEKSRSFGRSTWEPNLAIDLADRFGIPVFNLKNRGAVDRLKEWITSHPNYSVPL